MKKTLRIIAFISLVWVSVLHSFAQQIGVGEWQMHLPYTLATSITEGNGKIYVASGNLTWSYEPGTGEYEKLDKIKGFAGVNVSRIGFNDANQTLVIAYEDGTIDLFKNNEIIQLQQIKQSGITESRVVNSITMKGDTALLATNYGVVVLDVRKEVFLNVVLFSSNANFASENCYDIAVLNNRYYFALSNGIYSLGINQNILALTNWQKETAFPNGAYDALVTYQNRLVANYSGVKNHNNPAQDSIYQWVNGTVSLYPIQLYAQVRSFETRNDQICITTDSIFSVYDANGTLLNKVTAPFRAFRHGIIGANGTGWAAEFQNGAIEIIQNQANIRPGPESPYSANAYEVVVENDVLFVATGGRAMNYNNQFIFDAALYRLNGDWKRMGAPDFGKPISTLDIITIAVDPLDPTHGFYGSWGAGIFEFNNYSVTSQIYGSPLDTSSVSYPYRIADLTYDPQGNLWVSNSNTNRPLKVRYTDGTWQSFNFGNLVNNTSQTGEIEIDQQGKIWMGVIGKGILVFDPETNNRRLLNNAFNNGDLPDLNIRTIAIDKNSDVWVGSNNGLRIFSSSNVLTNSAVNGQKIVLTAEDGINELLLNETVITDIKVDGGNRKWIATATNGVRLVSEDGRTIIQSFTAENSPLLSNLVYGIGIDPKTGEVYFATSLGLCSYRADATEPDATYANAYAFPNPVRPEYSGLITITGLAESSEIKITDVNGNVVYETVSNGGSATWDGNRYNGQRAQSGVYLIFASNRDGSATLITKLVLLH